MVAHTLDEDDNLIRILSAQKATPQERRIYAQGLRRQKRYRRATGLPPCGRSGNWQLWQHTP
jgi:hypothetical protein